MKTAKENSPELKFYKTDRDFNPLEDEDRKHQKKSSVVEKHKGTLSKISVRSVSSLG